MIPDEIAPDCSEPQNIADELVEAAAEAFYMSGPGGDELHWDDLPNARKGYFRRRTSKALEVAFPRMMAEAWEAGAGAGYELALLEGPNSDYVAKPNPYRSQK